MKDEYEIWAAKRGGINLQKNPDGSYASKIAQDFWDCWQAARAK